MKGCRKGLATYWVESAPRANSMLQTWGVANNATNPKKVKNHVMVPSAIFTPVSAAIGGALIGLSAVLLMLFTGPYHRGQRNF
jgi:hypothetical protein